MRTFKVLAVLLIYPEREWLGALDELEEALRAESKRNAAADRSLAPLLAWLRAYPLVSLQQEYVALFDQEPRHSLHLFEHIHGESRERGPAMADLIAEYRRHGFEIRASELPDYLPLFLEYLSLLPEREARALLDEAIDVIAALRERLGRIQSPYHLAFAALERLSPVRAHPRPDTAPRGMDRAMKVLGPGHDGVEPVPAVVPIHAPMLKKAPRAQRD